MDIKASLLTLSAFGIFVSSCTPGTGASDPLAGIEKALYSLDVSFTETAKANPVANLSKERLQRFNGSASKTAHENALSFKSIDSDPLFLLEGFKGYAISVLECVGYPAEGGFHLTNRTYQIDLERGYLGISRNGNNNNRTFAFILFSSSGGDSYGYGYSYGLPLVEWTEFTSFVLSEDRPFSVACSKQEEGKDEASFTASGNEIRDAFKKMRDNSLLLDASTLHGYAPGSTTYSFELANGESNLSFLYADGFINANRKSYRFVSSEIGAFLSYFE